jgi:hypothetical protein
LGKAKHQDCLVGPLQAALVEVARGTPPLRGLLRLPFEQL